MRVLRTYARTYVANLDDVVPVLSRVTGQAAGARVVRGPQQD